MCVNSLCVIMNVLWCVLNHLLPAHLLWMLQMRNYNCWQINKIILKCPYIGLKRHYSVISHLLSFYISSKL